MSRKTLLATILTLFIVTLFFLSSFSGWSLFSQYETVTSEAGEVKIDVADVNDGKAHHYLYQKDGRDIKFFVVKSPDGVMRAAFDACDVCYPEQKGYSQDGAYMVCNNCGQRFHSNRVNIVKGGCNPAPLQRQLAGNQLLIKERDIVPGARFF